MIDKKLSRRAFFKTSAFVGGSAALAGCSEELGGHMLHPEARSAYPLNDAENVIYSVCLQCHTDCPIKVKIHDGVAVKIDGNPYGMQTLNPALPYATAIKDGAKVDGGLCPKGQAGLQTLYDPYRIRKVFKRAGKRGEGKWRVISFDDAIDEIVNGGRLFAHVPGEEDRVVTGLKDLYKLRDPDLAGRMAADAKAVGKGTMTVAAFKKKYAGHLDVLIDPDHPDLGPVNNQFVFQGGRIEHGRKEFAQRWLKGGFGSINWYEHTTICEQSHHIAFAEVTNQYKDGAWKGGTHHMKPDFYNARFVLFFGTGAFEANFGPPYMANLVTNRLVTGDLKFVVVDPRHSKTAAKAWKWLPVRPGGDAALAYALIRWLLDEEAYDADYLKHANRAAASAAGESTWTNATHLVRIEEDGPGALLRASDIGLGNAHTFVAVRNGRPVPVGNAPVDGDLFYEGTLNGIKVKTSFQVLAEYARSKTLEQWAEESGIEPELVVTVAREFARHGRQSVVEMYRGVVQHTNGYYNAQAVITLNLLMGNVDWKGGLSKGGGHWHEDGSKPGQPFPVKSAMHPGKLTAFGHPLTREKTHYEDSTLFREQGYPAKRPWFPHTSSVYQEIIPSAADGYPYPIKALMVHKGTPALSVPGGQKAIEALADPEIIPLFISSDVVIGDTSAYADYVFPDTAVWERWGTPHTTPACPVKQSKVRQPTIDPLTEKVTVFGQTVPLCMETVMLAIAERLNLPGYGKDGFGPGMDFVRLEDWFLKMVANLAAGDKPGDAVPAATEQEYAVFKQARRHLPPEVFDEAVWKRAVTDAHGRDWWPEVVYVLNRGGRFEDFDVYRNQKGPWLPHRFGGQLNVYVENVARTRHSYTGKRFAGLGVVEPVKGFNDQPFASPKEYPLALITYKDIRGGQSRTLPTDYWLSATLKENFVILNARTARELGLEDGQWVRVTSPDNPEGVWDLKNGIRKPMEGKVKIVQGMRPGVTAISWHYGHWAYGCADIEVDGEVVKGDPRRSRGLCPNAAMGLDPVLKNTCLEDLIGGSSSFYDTRVALVPV